MSKKAEYLTDLGTIATQLTSTDPEIVAEAKKDLRVISEEIRDFSVNKAARMTTTSLDGTANLAVIKSRVATLIASINNEWANDPTTKSYKEESK